MIYNRGMPRPNRLAHLRRFAGLTQKQVAELLGCDESMVSRYESGQVAVPDEAKLKLSARYDVSVSHLMNWPDDENGNGQNGEREQAVA